MAKKTPEVIDDDFNLDDFEDFDFDIPDPMVKDDRKPLTKVKAGLKEGALNQVKSPGFLKESLKHAFPPSFGKAVDMSDELTRSAKNLYDDSVAEIKPTLMMAKKTIGKLVPADSKMVPKKVQDVLQRWRDETEDTQSAQVSKDQAREGMLGQTLKDIFEAQQDTDQQRMADQVGRDNLKIGLEQVRYKTSLDALNRSAMSLKRLDDYSTTVGLSYQKKSLELQYRLLFASQDILEFSRQDVIRRNEFLATIAKNTALPEFVKLTSKEARQEQRRRKVFDLYNGALFGAGDKMIADGIAKMKRTVLEGTKGFMQDFRSGLQEAQMVGDMAGTGTMGDPTVLASQEAGAWGAQKTGNFLAKKLYGKVQGSSLDKRFGISDQFHKLDSGLENMPNALNEFKKSRKYDYDTSLKGSFMNFLQGLVPSMEADKALAPTTSKNLFQAAPFTVQTSRSINEVIPGFLARILREVQVLRTGDASIGLTDFSHDQGSFTDRGTLEKEVDAKLVPTRAVQRTRGSLDEIVAMIDPQGQMSDEERQALKKRLLTNSADRQTAEPHRLAKAEEYKKENASDAVSHNVAQRMDAFFQKLTPEERAKFVRKHNRLSEDMTDPRQHMQDMLETGNIDHLKAGNFITQKGTDVRVNMPELIRRYLEDNVPPGSGGTGGPDGGEPGAGGGGRLLSALGRKGRRVKRQAAVKAKSMASQVSRAANEALQGKVPAVVSTAAASLSQQAHQAADQLGTRAKGYGQRARSYAGALQMPLVKMPNMALPISDAQRDAIARAGEVARQHAQALSSKAVDLVHPDTLKQAAEGVSQIAQHAKDAVVPKLESVAQGIAQLKEDGKLPRQGIAALLKGVVEAGVTQGKKLGTHLAAAHQQLVKGLKSDETARKAQAIAEAVKSKAKTGGAALAAGATSLAEKVKGSATGAAAVGKAQLASVQQQLPAAKAAISEGFGNVAERLREKAVDAAGLGNQDSALYDVYVGSEKLPRITAAKLAQGLYYLKETGESVTKLSQIRGAIVDDRRNVVISPQELNQLVYFNPQRGTWTRLHGKPQMPFMGIVNNLADSFKTNAGALLKSAVTFVSDQFKKGRPSDVYVQGESEPRLTASKMAKGLYFDAESGDPIRTPRDIKGAVKDENGQTIIDKDDLSKLNVYNYELKRWSPLWMASKLLKGAIGAAKLAWKFETGFAWKWTKFNFRMLGKGLALAGSALGLRKSKDTVDGVPFKDVYVAGEKTPRLEATKFRKGEYFHRDTGQPIMHPKDIVGPVMDRNGNTLIDREDLKNLVVYNTGLGKFSPLRILGKILALPFKALGWVGKKALQGVGKVIKPVVKAGVKGAVAGTVLGAKMVAGVGKFALGIEKKAQPIGPMQQAQAEAKGNAERYKTLDRMKSSMGGAIGKVKSLFGPKLGMSQLAELPVGEAAAVKSASTLDKILGAVTGLTAKPKKDQYADDVKRMKDSESEPNKLRDDLDKKLHKKDEKGDGKDKEEKGGLLSSLLDKFGLGDLLGGGKGLLGKAGNFLKGSGGKLLGKLAMPLAAGAAAYGGIKAEGNGKKIENTADIIPEGFWNKLNPFAYAMNGGRFAGNMMNKQYDFMSKLFGGAGSLGSDVFSLFHKDPMKQMEEEEKKNKGAGASVASGDKAQTPSNADADKTLQALIDKGEFSYAESGDPRVPRAAQGASPELVQRYAEAARAARRRIQSGNTAQDDTTKKPVTLAQRVFNALPLGSAQAETLPKATKPADSVTNGKTLDQTAGGTGDDKPSVPDAEQKPPETAAAEGMASAGAGSATAPSSIPKAPGAPLEGSNGLSFLTLKNGVTLDGVNPSMRKELYAMVEEYGNATGKKVPINDGFRSPEDQARMYQKYGPGRAAKPGTSLHEFGLAVDIDSKTANEMEQMGLMRKYGFTRPVGREPWHVEPIGTQEDLASAKKDSGAATNMILAGLGKGGGGLGIDPSAKPFSRSRENSLAIAKASDADPTPTAGQGAAKDAFSTPSGNTAQTGQPGQSQATANAGYGGSASMLASSNVLTGHGPRATPVAISSVTKQGPSPSYGGGGAGGVDEGEAKPTAVPQIKVPTANMYGSVRATANSMVSNSADPTAKVPDPQGSGVDGLRPTLEGAAKLVGVDKNTVMSVVAMESGFNPNARAGTSSAKGLGQFTDGTWAEMMKQYGSKYGIAPGTPATDPKAASIMIAQYLKDNTDKLGQKTGMPIGPTEAYMGHFLGGGGASQFLRTMKDDPQTLGAQAMPKAAAANRPIFYDGSRPRTVEEIYALLDKRLRDKAKAFGIDTPATNMVTGSGSQTRPVTTGGGLDENAGSEGGGMAPKPTATPNAAAPLAMAGVPALGGDGGGTLQGPTMPAAAAMTQVAGPALPSAAQRPMAASASAASSLMGGMDSNVFAKAEDILAKSLAVQTEMRDALLQLVKQGGTAASAAAPAPSDSSNQQPSAGAPAPAQPPKGPAYDIPRGAVSMKRAIA